MKAYGLAWVNDKRCARCLRERLPVAYAARGWMAKSLQRRPVEALPLSVPPGGRSGEKKVRNPALLMRALYLFLALLLGVGLVGCGDRAQRTIEAVEESYERALDWSMVTGLPGDLTEQEENEWLHRLSSFGRSVIGPVVRYYRCHNGRGGTKEDTARLCVRALGELQDPKALPDLVGLSRDTDFELARYAILGVRRLAEADDLGQIVDLIGRLPAEWETHRVLLLELLGKFGTSQAKKFLRGYLESGDPVVRRGALRGIARSGDLSYLADVLTLLEKDPDGYVRIAAAEAALRLGDDSKEQYLMSIVRGDNARDAVRAMCAFTRAKGPAAVPVLAELLRSHTDRYVRSAAREGLHWIGTAEATEILRQAGPVRKTDERGTVWLVTQRYRKGLSAFDVL